MARSVISVLESENPVPLPAAIILEMTHTGGEDKPVSATTPSDKQDVDVVEVTSEEDRWLGFLNQQPLPSGLSWEDKMSQEKELALLEEYHLHKHGPVTSRTLGWYVPSATPSGI